MTLYRDFFEPRTEPARSIYLAFQAEAKLRKSRSVNEWIEAERRVVHQAAIHQAELLGLREPTLEDVEAAERTARGHVDYGSKWAYGICDAINYRPLKQAVCRCD
jgi:hypothetical protein